MVNNKINEELNRLYEGLGQAKIGSEEYKSLIRDIMNLGEVAHKQKELELSEKKQIGELEVKKSELKLREKEINQNDRKMDIEVSKIENDKNKAEKDAELREKEMDKNDRKMDIEVSKIENDKNKAEKDAELREKEMEIEKSRNENDANLREAEIKQNETKFVVDFTNAKKERRIEYLKIAGALIGTIAGAVFAYKQFREGLEFEEEGTFTSLTLRNLMSKRK